MLNANLTSNGYFSPPGGYPFSLSVGQDTVQGVVPKGAVTIVAEVEAGYIADCHLAIYTMPTTSGGDDGALVDQVDSLAVTTTGATLTLTIPSASSDTPTGPAEYIVRLWFDNSLSGTADAVARDTAVTDTTTQPLIPYGVTVTSFTVT